MCCFYIMKFKPEELYAKHIIFKVDNDSLDIAINDMLNVNDIDKISSIEDEDEFNEVLKNKLFNYLQDISTITIY